MTTECTQKSVLYIYIIIFFIAVSDNLNILVITGKIIQKILIQNFLFTLEGYKNTFCVIIFFTVKTQISLMLKETSYTENLIKFFNFH